MKISRVLLMAACLIFSIQGHAQKISLSLKNASLEKVFKLIEQQSSYRFVYTDEAMSLSKPVSVEVKNETLENTLQLCFSNQPLGYSFDDKMIIVRVAEKKAETVALTHDVNGTVTNENGEPLGGASIKIKETNFGTVANEKGEFILKNVNNNSTIIISNVGYEKLEIALQEKISLRAELKIAVNNLDETLIIAYGKTTQRYNTGSVSKVSGAVISKQPVTNPLAALEGRVAGLVVTQSNGVAGSFIKVQLRGQNSLAQGSEPLFIIDGVPFAPNNTPVNQLSSAAASFAGGGLSPFNSINPADIESIEVLKDADATAIYGSRGANGVILITTKKGKAGKTRFNINGYTGLSRVTRTQDMLNANQYLQMRHEAFKNDSVLPTVANAPDLLVWDTSRYTDFKKLLIGGTAQTADVQASLTGGNSNTQFLLSGNYHNETTVFPGDLADNRTSVNLSVNHASTDQKFAIALSAIYSSDKNAINSADLTRYINLAPDAPVLYDSARKLNWQEGGITFNNPLSYLLQKYTAQTDNLLSNVLISYRIFPSLTLRASAGYNTYNLDEINTNPIASQNPAYNPKGYSEFAYNTFKSWIIEPQAEYSKSFGRFRIDALIGSTWQKTLNNYSSFSADGYINDALLTSLGAASSVSVDGNDATDYRYAALFGRININHSNKYILNLSGRRDGSSRFGPGKQFADFGAIGGAWIFSNESFVKKSIPFLSYGKIRGSYGTTGNDQIGDYQFLNTWTSSNYSYQHIHGLYPTRLFSPDYSWEINRKAEGAIELGFLKDRILLTAAYFINRSSNELIQYQLPLQTGFGSVLSNFPATVQNRGLELSFSNKIVQQDHFTWSSSVTLTVPHNKLVSFPGLSTSTYANKYIVGSSINIVKGYEFLGVNPTTGIFEFSDVNKDGKLDSKDLVVLGNLDPSYYGGLLNSVTYKGFEGDIFFEFKRQTGKNYFASIYNPYVYPPGAMGNQPVDVLARWQKSGDITGIEKFTSTYGTPAFTALSYLGSSGAVYSNASFIRLKNVSLSYTFPATQLKKYYVESCRVYVQCQNLITITSYKGSDPETQNFYALPPLKTVTAGIQFTF